MFMIMKILLGKWNLIKKHFKHFIYYIKTTQVLFFQPVEYYICFNGKVQWVVMSKMHHIGIWPYVNHYFSSSSLQVNIAMIIKHEFPFYVVYELANLV